MIAWADIEAECGNYREGFVAVFRRYEGQATDEKDAQGRTVKVTVTSFARHMRIPPETFRGWVKITTRVIQPDQRAGMDASKARKVLRDAPLEQVEQLVAGLPAERQQAIAAAAGHGYLKARQEQDEQERRRTPAERREREQARESLTRPIRQATGGFASLGIVGHLEQATEELRELNADASLTPQATRKIGRALDEFVTEFNFAKAMLGEGEDR